MTTISPIVAQYADHLDRVGKSPNTVRAYSQDMAAFGQWFEGTTGQTFDPQLVDPRDIGAYRGFLIQRNRRPSTVNRRLIAIKRFFDWAKAGEQVTDSPFDILEKFLLREQTDTAPRWLTHSESLSLGQRGPLTQRAINYVLGKYSYNARLEDVSAHTLRHSCAKNLVDAGVSLDQVAALLGHERLDTVSIYTRPSQADLERAVRWAAGELADE